MDAMRRKQGSHTGACSVVGTSVMATSCLTAASTMGSILGAGAICAATAAVVEGASAGVEAMGVVWLSGLGVGAAAAASCPAAPKGMGTGIGVVDMRRFSSAMVSLVLSIESYSGGRGRGGRLRCGGGLGIGDGAS